MTDVEILQDCNLICGIDRSKTTDLTAVTLLVKKGDTVWFFTRFYKPRNKMEEATARDGAYIRCVMRRKPGGKHNDRR